MQRVGIPGLERVSWDDISLVAAIADFGSLRQAAKAFGVSASTLVRRVEKLEASLGTTVLDRLPHGFELNVAGQAIAAVARDMQEDFRRLQDIARLDARPEGRVRLAITEGLGSFWLAPQLPAFNAAHPALTIDMATSMDLRNLLRNEADVAVQLKRPDSPDLVAVRLCHLHIYPFAALSYLERHGVPAPGEPERRHRIVMQESEQLASGPLFALLERHGISHEVAFVTNSSIAHYCAVEQGLGIGGVPTYAMALGAKVVPLDLGIHHTTEVWLCFRPEMRKVKRVSLVIDWLREAFDPKRYPWFGPTFIHPAALMEGLGEVEQRPGICDFTRVKDLFAPQTEAARSAKPSAGRATLRQRGAQAIASLAARGPEEGKGRRG